jgi:hypothetical protein
MDLLASYGGWMITDIKRKYYVQATRGSYFTGFIYYIWTVMHSKKLQGISVGTITYGSRATNSS